MPIDTMSSSPLQVRLPFPIYSMPSSNLNLSKSSRETTNVISQLSVVAQELNISTINQNLSCSLLLHVLFTTERSEAPVFGNDDLLATRELVLGTTKSLERIGTVRITSADAQDDLTNVDTGNGSVGLSPCTTHSSLESIGSGTRQHLVDTDDVVWMSADTEMEGFLSCGLDHVFIGTNTGSFESLGAQLFVLIGNHVNAERKLVDICSFPAEIEDTDLWVRDTSVEAGLWVRLILAVTITSRWTTCHLE